MKTSNIILSASIGSITFMVILGMVSSNLTSTPRKPPILEPENHQTHSIELQNFNYLEITESEDFFMEVSTGHDREIQIITRAGTEIPQVDYHISGDTLFIDNFHPSSNNSNWWVSHLTIYIPEGELKGVKGKNAKLKFKNFEGTFPEIDTDKSQTIIENTSGKGKLVCNVRNKSTLTINNQMDSLYMHLNNSTLRINKRLALIQGEIMNNSTLNYKSACELVLKQDETSLVKGVK
jgi:hypothetical protein